MQTSFKFSNVMSNSLKRNFINFMVVRQFLCIWLFIQPVKNLKQPKVCSTRFRGIINKKSALFYSATFKYMKDVPIDNVIPNEPILPLKAVPCKTYNPAPPAPPCNFVLNNFMPKM